MTVRWCDQRLRSASAGDTARKVCLCSSLLGVEISCGRADSAVLVNCNVVFTVPSFHYLCLPLPFLSLTAFRVVLVYFFIFLLSYSALRPPRTDSESTSLPETAIKQLISSSGTRYCP